MTSISFAVSTALWPTQSMNLQPIPANISYAATTQPYAQIVQISNEPSNYSGFLYTPFSNNSCGDIRTPIPTNLTYADLPALDGIYSRLIGIAPADACLDSYVSRALLDNALALILYPANNRTVLSISSSSSVYGANIPVYSLTWQAAATLVAEMNAYNTVPANLPFGGQLANQYGDDQYIRLMLNIQRRAVRNLPGLWIFLLIVLGILCLIVAATSLAMHAHQYLARRDLRRRIASGEVDLEGLGIKRLTVPKKYIDALPQRKWSDDTKGDCLPKHASIPTYNQTNCSICLEDYENKVTLIRQLPCHHIYHPACIDSFLMKRSSLCPLCKQSVLPKGYIPPDALLTSATVMRERRRRRQAARASRSPDQDSAALEMTITAAQPQIGPQRADLTALAPDNEEELQELPQENAVRRLWHKLFPARNV